MLKYLEDKKQLVIKIHSAEEIVKVCSSRISAEKKYKNIQKGALK